MPGRGVVFQIFQHCLLIGQARVHMLGVDADLAAVAPADFARQRLERIDDGPQKRGLALAIVAHDRRPRSHDRFRSRCRRRLRAPDKPIANSRQRTAAPLRGSTSGARMLAVGSSPAISVISSRSSCLLFERARVAVLARALFLAMNSSSCRRLAKTAAFERSSCSRRSR